jgi:hypothetical protein
MSARRLEGCMKPGELERIRIVTRHFVDLQGLRWNAPLGVLLLLNGASMLARNVFLSIACGLVAFANLQLALATKRFYRRRFGEVEGFDTPEPWGSGLAPHGPRYFGGVEGPRGRPMVRRHLDGGWLTELFLLLIGFAAAGMLGLFRPTQGVELLCTVFGAALLWRWTRLEMIGAQWYYPVLSALLLAAAAFHGAAVVLVPALGRVGGGLVLVGGAWMVAGLLDHRTLERALRSAGMRRGLFARAREDVEETPWEEMQRGETR